LTGPSLRGDTGIFSKTKFFSELSTTYINYISGIITLFKNKIIFIRCGGISAKDFSAKVSANDK
jgi:hypothetical protein